MNFKYYHLPQLSIFKAYLRIVLFATSKRRSMLRNATSEFYRSHTPCGTRPELPAQLRVTLGYDSLRAERIGTVQLRQLRVPLEI